MQLGVVMTGTGAYAASAIGVMQALADRGIEPHAVCGLQAGAWPAALYLSGRDAHGMARAAQEAAQAGGGLVRMRAFPDLRRGRCALAEARKLERLLLSQLGAQPLALCPRRGIMVCRAAQPDHRVVFSSRAYRQESGVVLGMQVSLSFAARAAMALPPFLAPMLWMGTPLLPEESTAFACRQLLEMGAQRVLIVMPQMSGRRRPDALELTGLLLHARQIEDERVGLLRVTMPEELGARSVAKLPACVQAGRETAERELDALLRQLGMGVCRVLPFRRSSL